MKTSPASKHAFTLAELLLAMLVFAIAISTILALLARSIETADEILLKDEAMNLTTSLEGYMEALPFFDAADSLNAYEIVQDTNRGALYAFQYAGDLSATPNADGSLVPYEITAGSELGTDYTITPTVRDPDEESTELTSEIDARVGRVFYVILSESLANPFTEENGLGALPADPNADADTDGLPDYDSAVLVIQAEFYAFPTVLSSDAAITNILDNSDPVFSYNFAVRR